MKKIIQLLDTDLALFDGQGGGEAGGQTGETQASPGTTRRGKSGEYSDVVFGKQGVSDGAPAGQQTQAPDAGEREKQGVETTSDTREAKRRAYRDLVNGEYKEFYTEDTQRIINSRFKDVKALETQLGQIQPVLDLLNQRYGIQDGDLEKLAQAVENDDAYWSEAAEEAGLSVEQYKQFQQLQRQNEALLRQQRQQRGQEAAQRQLQQWYQQAEAMKGDYPSFDLGAESQNPQFLAMLRAGVPVQHAYEVVHMDEIKAGVAKLTAKATEKQVVSGIRAKGARPQENGTAAQSPFTVKDDVSKLTRKDRAEIARRVARGETISF